MRSSAGVLGIVALFAAIIVGMFATFGAFGEKGTARSTELAEEAQAKEQQTGQGQSAAAIGETVTAGDVSWTITDASMETELSTFTFPPQTIPGNYVSLIFTVENISNEPVTLTGETITIFDQSGFEYQPEPDRNNIFVEPERNLLFSEYSLLEPGATKEGRVNFGVLENSSGFTARLGDTDPTSSEEQEVNLGF